MLPWGQIITTSLTLADLAQNLYKKTKNKSKNDDDSTDGLLARVKALELLQVEQSNLLQKIAEQNNLMVKKVRNAYIIAIVSPIISVIILFVYLFFP